MVDFWVPIGERKSGERGDLLTRLVVNFAFRLLLSVQEATAGSLLAFATLVEAAIACEVWWCGNRITFQNMAFSTSNTLQTVDKRVVCDRLPTVVGAAAAVR